MVAVPRQPALRGSDRAYRGEILRRLTMAEQHRLPITALRAEMASELGDTRWDRVLSGLERDRLIHRFGGDVRLGAATIGA